ncbi:MAG TPA: alginate lyase family protein [Pyrinomonadaceae bacterium]|nr:alginate lyase family protein [Pyrinomonadaceae bacterium]
MRLLILSGTIGLAFLTVVAQQQAVFDVQAYDRARVLKAANQYLSEPPITVTASTSPRSAGGAHDFFSEGDYWWPDPKNPNGPYIQRDGMSNPDNFTDHRRYLMRLSVQVPALVAAWKITGDARYAKHAAEHLRAWFLNEKTRMNPNLQYAQAIHGITTGRGTGIIDTIHLVEVARAIEVMQGSNALTKDEIAGIKKWFTDYLQWMTTSKNGTDERDAKNNHGTCWVMQVAAFAHLVGNQELMNYCRTRFKTVLIPNQEAEDGSFPQELRRTKPYGYSLFNLEAMTTICQILSTAEDNLWTFELSDGRGIRKAVEYMFPYIRDKKSWPLKPDVMYDKEWPMRQSSLLFAGLALNRPDYIELWKRLPADSTVEEVIRNFFIRQPVLWVETADKRRKV